MAKLKMCWVTTLDNPFDYFTETENWIRFDEDHGYYTTNYIMRLADCNSDLPPDIKARILEEACDDICELNITGNYKKISCEVDSEEFE